MDLMILETIKNYEEGLCCAQISRTLKKAPPQIHLRLKKLERENILSATKGYPKFYKISFKDKPNNINWEYFECPNCKWISKVVAGTQFATCQNPNCKPFPSGRKRRFYCIEKRRRKSEDG